MIYGKQNTCIYHIWFERIWLFALVVNCPKLDVFCFLSCFKRGCSYVSWDFFNHLRHFCKNEPIPRHHVYFSSGGTIFKNKGLQNLQSHFSAITQCVPQACAKQWQREISQQRGGKTAAQLKSLLTNTVIWYLTVGSFGIWGFSQMQKRIVY